MNELRSLLSPAVKLFVLAAPHAGTPQMLELAARLSLSGPLRVLDGGNRFNVYPVSQAIRRLSSDLYGALGRITLSRAFTCYQVLALLSDTPITRDPTLVLDLLSSFYDESVTLKESRRLLELAIDHLKRLSDSGPVLVSVKPPAPICAERMILVDRLLEVADHSQVLGSIQNADKGQPFALLADGNWN